MIQWSEKLASGHGVIDQQHQALFEHINQFLASFKDVPTSERLGNTVRFLTEYVDFHFKTEEQYMDAIQYPNRDNHKLQHAWFKMQLQSLIDDMSVLGPCEALSARAEGLLVRWFINHIETEDAAVGHHHSRNGAGSNKTEKTPV